MTNYERYGRTADSEYQNLLAEMNRRSAPELQIQATIEFIRNYAADHKFVSYGQVAQASGVEWQTVHRKMPFHLREVCKIAHSRGWPLITSIVVNQQHLATGAMEPSSMSGFINAAHALRLPVTDEAAFVREQQKATFEWARRGGLAETHA